RRPPATARQPTSAPGVPRRRSPLLEPLRDFPAVDPRFRLIAVRRSRPETRASNDGTYRSARGPAISAGTKVLVISTVLTLFCSLAASEVAAQAVTLAPANPVIFVGQTQQFTATGIDTATSIEAGTFHQCALLQDTTVRCWGENDYGQLGGGTISSALAPPNPTAVAVVGLTGATGATGGAVHSRAPVPNGTLPRRRRDSEGQLGGQATT